MMITVKVRGAIGIDNLMGGGGGHEIAVPEGTTVRELLDILADKYGDDFRNIIYQNEKKELRQGLSALLNDRELAAAGGLDTRLQDGDHLSIIPVLAGG